MENRPDHEYQRIHLLRAVRHARIDAGELWLHYFGLGGDAGEYEVEAYLHGSFTLPPLQRDLLAHAANELIDRLPPPLRAPYSTDPSGEGAGTDAGSHGARVPHAGGAAFDWLYEDGADTDPDGSSTDSTPGAA